VLYIATLLLSEIFTCPLVREDVHALFDKGGFILLPEDDVVEKYRRGGKPDFNGDVRGPVLFPELS
jgi:hypothetical protein